MQTLDNISGIWKLSTELRQKIIEDTTKISLSEFCKLPRENEICVENMIGYYTIPVGIVTRFHVDNKHVILPMAIEEKSVIAGINSVSKWISDCGGSINTTVLGKEIIGQIHFPDYISISKKDIHWIKKLANEIIEQYKLFTKIREPRITLRSNFNPNRTVLHVHVVSDKFMGANLVTYLCELLSKEIRLKKWAKHNSTDMQSPLDEKPDYSTDPPKREGSDSLSPSHPLGVKRTNSDTSISIVTNYSTSRLVKSNVSIPLQSSDNIELAQKVVTAHNYGFNDIYRATTENKGIMNAIDSILLVTGNDYRSVESACHAYACRKKKYRHLSNWKISEDGKNLVGELVLPMIVGTSGGGTNHPAAKTSLKIMNVTDNDDLARICVAAGLVQNLSALKALASENFSQKVRRL